MAAGSSTSGSAMRVTVVRLDKPGGGSAPRRWVRRENLGDCPMDRLDKLAHCSLPGVRFAAFSRHGRPDQLSMVNISVSWLRILMHDTVPTVMRLSRGGSSLMIVLEAAGIVLMLVGIALLIFRFQKSESGMDKQDENPAVATPFFSITGPAGIIVILIGAALLYLGVTHTAKGASNPDSSATGNTTSPTATKTGHSGAVSLVSPVYGAHVGGCAVFTGTADLNAQTVVVLGDRNLSDPTRTMYLEPVNDWKSRELSSWAGYLYFGSGNSSVGQTYDVYVIVMPFDVVVAAKAQPANNPTWAVTSLPSGAQIEETIRVMRVAGQGSAICR